VYTAAMKFCMGQSDRATFEKRATRALERMLLMSDTDWLTLHFKHLGAERIESAGQADVDSAMLASHVAALADRLEHDNLDLTRLPHSGFKDFTEGPSADTPVLLRQDAYKALTEPVVFAEADGSEIEFQLRYRFTDVGGFWYEKSIFKPIASGFKVYVDGNEVASGWTIDETTGRLSFLSAPEYGSDVTWTGDFDLPVRFDTDQLEAVITNKEVISFPSLPIVELKL